MRIGLTTSVIQHGKTGIAEYVFALVRAFESYAASHQFVLFVLEKDLPLFEFARKFAQIVPVPERFRPPLKDIFWHQAKLPKLARKLQLDVLHVRSYRRMLWRHPCATVATIHDLAPFHVARKYDWKRMFYGRVVARRLAARQDEIIAISENTVRDIATFWNLRGRNISVIHQGLDHKRFFPAARDEAKISVRRRFGLEQPFFLYVARLQHPGKNHLRLIAAFERFKAQTGLPWQLVFAGSDWLGAEEIHAAVRRSPFIRDIRPLGYVPEEDLPMVYHAADVFVFPSLYEGFGFPPLEAMACGCPVLCSTRGALREVVGESAATVDPEAVSALATQLIRLSQDESLRSHLQLAGIARARSFDWQQTAAQTMSVYSRAFNGANSRESKSGRSNSLAHARNVLRHQ